MARYDVAVIGGGPAGMMAAGRAAECGARVVLLEKNDTLGVKLLITGGGRSNVTNAEFNRHALLRKFKDASKFLFSPFDQFGVENTLDFFHTRGMPTKIEAEKRVFPTSDSAQSVWDTLVQYMQENQVTVKSSSEVAGFEVVTGKIVGLRLKKGELLEAQAFVLATGGKSRPETGSTGDGFRFLEEIGHTVIAPRPALVPLRVKEKWAHSLSGLSFPDVKLTVFQNGKKEESHKGKLLFTHFGLSGPLALNMSKNISDFLEYGVVTVSIDFFPHQNIGEIDTQVLSLLETQKNKLIKNSLDSFVPPLLLPILLELSGINPDTPVHSVSREKRLMLVRLTKDFRVTVTGLLGTDKAVVTSGGIALEEVDFKYMRSRLYPNLYLAGDILNINRPSGGYSLQLCWTTGYVAGTSAARK